MNKTDRVLTGVGARQVVPRIRLFDDVFMDLVPLTLCVTPEKERRMRHFLQYDFLLKDAFQQLSTAFHLYTQITKIMAKSCGSSSEYAASYISPNATKAYFHQRKRLQFVMQAFCLKYVFSGPKLR